MVRRHLPVPPAKTRPTRRNMIKRAYAFHGPLRILLALAFAVAINACRLEKPGPEPVADDTASQPPATPADTSASPMGTGEPFDTSASGTTIGTPGSGAVTGEGSQGWNRAELIQGVQHFIAAIDSTDSEMFWHSLSERSLTQIDRGHLGSRDEVWTTARQTLGDIENRRITVIGGRTDSVALRIDGLRLIDSVRENDPIIIHLLRERGGWKVMYPGLLYPQHHLRR